MQMNPSPSSDQAPSPAWWWWLLTALPVLWFMANLEEEVWDYSVVHHFFNYDNGFQRRGLVGEVAGSLFQVDTASIYVLSYASLLVMVAGLFLFFARELLGRVEARALAAFLLCGPAVLPHFASLMGGIDILFVILMTAVAALWLWRRNLLTLLITTALTALGMLMHEAFAVMVYPLFFVLVVTAWLERELPLAGVLLHLATIGGVFLAIIAFGNREIDIPAVTALIYERTGIEQQPGALDMLSRSVTEQMAVVFKKYKLTVLLMLAVTLTLAAPYLYVLFALVIRTGRAMSYSILAMGMLILVLLAPLVLILVGHDMMRWVSFACLNLTFWFVIMWKRQPELVGPIAVRVVHLPGFAVFFLWTLALGGFQRLQNSTATEAAQRSLRTFVEHLGALQLAP